MLTYLIKKVNILKGISGFLLAFFVVIFFNLGFFPLNQALFTILAIILFILASYNPHWFFGLFLATLPLEIVNLAPQTLGIAMRPYQLIGIILILAIFLKLIQGKFHIFRFKKMDWLVFGFAIFGFLGYFGAVNSTESLKQALILVSFVAFYFLGRIFFQNLNDLKRFLPWFLGSALFVMIYGTWQNWQFLHGGNHFEVMPGRANSTFTEADWLGMFLILVLSIVLIWIYSESFKMKSVKRSLFLYFYLLLTFLSIIITVSRSAWLGAGMVMVFFFIFLVWKFWKNKSYGNFRIIFSVILTGIISLFLVEAIPLTNFELGNRIQSTGSGLQEITISCKDKQTIEQLEHLQQLQHLEHLEQLNCRHINLEEIESEKGKGNFVTRIKRKDPNVDIRGKIYQTSWEQIKKNFWFGIGWGNIAEILGKDDRGVGLNSSNIFLQIWLGSGWISLVLFLLIISLVIKKSLVLIFKKKDSVFGIYLLLGILAIIIPNLFNAGLFLGFLWIFFSSTQADNL